MKCLERKRKNILFPVLLQNDINGYIMKQAGKQCLKISITFLVLKILLQLFTAIIVSRSGSRCRNRNKGTTKFGALDKLDSEIPNESSCFYSEKRLSFKKKKKSHYFCQIFLIFLKSTQWFPTASTHYSSSVF